MNRTDSPRTAARVDFPPALALPLRRALQRLRGKQPDFVGLAAVVEIDPVLTGSILRTLRCPVYGGDHAGRDLARPLETIGRAALDRMLAGLPLVDEAELEVACRGWTHGLAVAAAARWISNQGAYDSPEEAYLAGLVHDVGRLVADEHGGAHERATRTEAIVSAWRLGPRVAAVARWRHALAEGASIDALAADAGGVVDRATAKLLGVVSRAAAYAAFFGRGGDDPVADAAGDDPDAAAVREAIELELAHAADVLGMPPGPMERFAETLVHRELRARREAREEETPSAREARSASRVADLHREIIDARGVTAISDMLDRGLREIHDKLEFDRLLLLEPDPADATLLRARFCLDPTRIDFHRGLGGVHVPLDPDGAIARVLATETACRGGDPALDRDALDFLGVSSFAAAPLHAGGAHLGVVVADQFFSARPVTDGDVAVLTMLCSALGLAMENAALDAATKKLRALAEKDELTGVNNRRNVLAVLQREIDRARRYGKPLSLAMVDVDHFKSWNDLHGHQVGDQVLQAVAQLISSCSREHDAFGRYGGEEFLVVLPETAVDAAMVYAERLRTTIEGHGEVLRATYPDRTLSISVGLSTMSQRGDDAERMIHRADTALYAAKKHGRNRVCVEMPTSDPARAAAAPAHGDADAS